MNILVLNPPRRDKVVMVKDGRCMQPKGAWGYVMSPVTMVTIATVLRDDGHTVKVVDAGVDANDFERLLAQVREFKPDLAIINTSTPTIEDDMYASRLLKERCRKPLVTVLFGVHVTVMFESILSSPNRVGFCVLGEPEMTIRELAAGLKDGRDLKDTAGLAFLDPKDPARVVRTKTREFIKDLDVLPIPDWSFVDTDNYRLPLNNEKFLLVNTNRGCPYRCTFCNAHIYYGRVPRRRSVEHIMREIRNDVERFGVTSFMIWTEEFILDKPFVKAFCQAILDSGLAIRWVCNSRVDAVDEETLRLVKKAGCWQIAYGIESGIQGILDSIKKQNSLAQNRMAVELAKKAGLQVTGHVIVGLPGDTAGTMAETEKFINSLGLDFVQYYCATPYPGTELYDEAKRNGWINSGDWSRWEQNFAVLDYPHLKSAEVMATRNRFLRRYYFRPKIAFRILRDNIRRSGDIFPFIRSVKGFLEWM